MRKAISILILAAVIAFILSILTSPRVDPNGNLIRKSHSKDMTGFAQRQPNKLAEYTGGNGVVSPIFFKQASDGSIVEATTQPLVVGKTSNYFDEFMDKYWIETFGSLGAIVGVLVIIIILKRGPDYEYGPRSFESAAGLGPESERSLSTLLRELSVSEGIREQPESRTGPYRYNQYSRPHEGRHVGYSALGAWAQHIRTGEAERTLNRTD